MKVYQIMTPKGFETLPFSNLDHAYLYISQKGLPDYILEPLEISPGEKYRNWNTIYQKDKVFKGIVKGVIYSDHPEHLKA